MTRLSRAASTTTLVNCLRELISRIRSRLCEQAVQQPEVSTGDADDRGGRFLIQRMLGKMHAGRRPVLIK